MSLTILAVALASTFIFEVFTCAGRFGFGFRSREIAPRYKRYTFGVRIHHGYVGAAAVPPAFLPVMAPPAQAVVLGLAAGLIVSDLIHHFVVLPILTGQFD
jgi:hypothetical protein